MSQSEVCRAVPRALIGKTSGNETGAENNKERGGQREGQIEVTTSSAPPGSRREIPTKCRNLTFLTASSNGYNKSTGQRALSRENKIWGVPPPKKGNKHTSQKGFQGAGRWCWS